MAMANLIEASRMYAPAVARGVNRLASLVPQIRLDDTPNIFAQTGLTFTLIAFTGLVFGGIIWAMSSAARSGMFDHLHEPKPTHQRCSRRDNHEL